MIDLTLADTLLRFVGRLHPALVHFPIACWSLGSAVDAASLWLPVGDAATLLLIAGTVIALPVMLAGALDARQVKDKTPASRVLAMHMSFVMVAWLAYAMSLLGRWDGESLVAPGAFALVLSGAGFLSLLTAGWYGGQLVYGHGIGVRVSPESS